MRPGCKRRLLFRVKESRHEHVSGSEKWGCVVGVASDDCRDRMAVMDHGALGVIWSGEVRACHAFGPFYLQGITFVVGNIF